MGSGSLKWDDAASRFGAEVLPMWVADMDFASPEAVQAALAERVSHPVYGYPSGKEAILRIAADWIEKRHGFQPDPDHLLLMNGVVSGISAAVRAFTRIGENVLVLSPAIPPFFSAVQEQERTLLEVPLRKEKNNRYEIDWPKLETLLPEARMLVLCSPHNPTGRVWDYAELYHLGSLASRHGVFVLSDEVHADLAYPGHPHTPFAQLFPDSLLLGSAGKSFNIAGIGGAFALLEDDQHRKCYAKELRRSHLDEMSLFSLTAMKAAWEKGQPWLDRLRDYLHSNASHLGQRLSTELPGIDYVLPEFGYLAWLDLRALGLEDQDIAGHLLKARLGLSPGPYFGSEGHGFVRLNFGTSRAILDEGMDRLAQAFG